MPKHTYNNKPVETSIDVTKKSKKEIVPLRKEIVHYVDSKGYARVTDGLSQHSRPATELEKRAHKAKQVDEMGSDYSNSKPLSHYIERLSRKGGSLHE